MIILSLDQSSHTTGYSIFKDDELFKFGNFSVNDSDIGQRLVKIRNKVEALISEYKPDHVVFEDIQLQNNISNNVQTFKALAQVYGVISELLSRLNIPYSIVTSTSWKATLGVKGRTRPEQKRSAQDYVINKYNVKPTQDECDSICIGEHYILNEKGAW